MRQTLAAFCAEHDKAELLTQWNAERNAPLTPQSVTYGSKRKVWWHCSQGHGWQAAVYSRTRGSGCPYCAGQRVAHGSDLLSRHPKLAAQWDHARNAPFTPHQVAAGSHRPVWWRCEKGHSWRSAIRVRVAGCGCPVCAGRVVQAEENSLAATDPALLDQWDDERNHPLTPQQLSRGSRRKVWWRCGAGHSWKAAVSSRTLQGSDCPVCAGKSVLKGFNDLSSVYPLLAREWDSYKNGCLTPDAVGAASSRKAWWRCEHGHSYCASIAQRARHSTGCPYCAGRKVLPGFNDLATRAPQVAAQWHPTLNGALTSQQVTAKSHRKVWWQCQLGHAWKAIIYSRTGKQAAGCPVCAGRRGHLVPGGA